MYAVARLEPGAHWLSLKCHQEEFVELLECPGIVPAPYLARAHWVATADWSTLRLREWQAELRNAHAVVFAKLPKRTRDVLALPIKQRDSIITERKKKLAAPSRAR